MQGILMILGSLLFIGTGVLLLYDPRKYYEILNRYTRWASGSDDWAQFSPEVTSKFSARLMHRLVGVIFVFLGIAGFAAGTGYVADWLRGGTPSPPPMVVPNSPKAPPGLGLSIIALAELLCLVIFGLGLLVFPRQLIRRFGTERYFLRGEATLDRLSRLFRLVGLIFLITALRTLFN
jgi:hypothetical protein